MKNSSKLHSTLRKLHSEDEVDFFSKNEKNTSAKEGQADAWFDDESYDGQLSVDVYQTKDDVVIQSTIAGVKPEHLDISIQSDMVTIRGKRSKSQEVTDEDYLYQECYWGGFSRSIILPVEVRDDKAIAEMENGILTISLPKANKTKVTTLKVKNKES